MAEEVALRKPGRPRKEDTYSWFPRFLDGIDKGYTRGNAAKYAGVQRDTAMTAFDRRPEMRDQVLDREEASLEVAGQVLYKIMMDDDHPDQFKAAKYITETRLRQWQRSADRLEITTVNVNLGTPPEDLNDRISRVLARIEARAESVETTGKEIEP